MRFATKHTCHRGALFAPPNDDFEARGDCFHCSYCGSLSLADLMAHTRVRGVRLVPTDWKHGWPHKFYVEGLGAHAKLYVAHLVDEGLDDEAFASVVDLLWRQTGIHYVRRAGKLGWRRVPYGEPLTPEEIAAWGVQPAPKETAHAC